MNNILKKYKNRKLKHIDLSNDFRVYFDWIGSLVWTSIIVLCIVLHVLFIVYTI
jgi:hypothetical protein